MRSTTICTQNELWRRVQNVFEQALRLSIAERLHYVRATCAGSQNLIDEVESLLAAYDAAEEALERPPQIEIEDQEEF